MASATQWSNLKLSSATIKDAVCGTVKVEVSLLLDFVKLTDLVGKKVIFEKGLNEVELSEDGIGRMPLSEYHTGEDADRQSLCRIAENHLKSVCVRDNGDNCIVPVFSIIDAETLNSINL